MATTSGVVTYICKLTYSWRSFCNSAQPYYIHCLFIGCVSPSLMNRNTPEVVLQRQLALLDNLAREVMCALEVI